MKGLVTTMNKIPASSRIRTTTIRATTDILQKPNQQQQIFPAAALRICDHHLHSSGIIPRVLCDQDNTRIYAHDWFCVSQAVRCYPQSSLLHSVVSGADPCFCDVWVNSDAIGNSSIQFNGLVSIGNDILAAVRRVFVRTHKLRTTSTHDSKVNDSSGTKRKSASFSDEEKQRFRKHFSFEALGIGDNYKASDAKKIQDLVQIKKTESDSSRLETRISELEEPLSVHQENSFTTSVTVGPQHINFGNHADHAFLAETAFHALTETSNKLSSDYLSIQYKKEVFLGDNLESYGYRQYDTDEEMNTVILVATRKLTGDKKVVLIAHGD